MSLFKTEEFWSTRCGVDETFNNYTLSVANFFPQQKESDQIICGSLKGILRLYSRVESLNEQSTGSDGDTNPFSLTSNSQNKIELSVEYNVRQPILQLATGKFITERNISLAVLTPQKLMILIIDEVSMTFKLMEEFNLQRTAFNFCCGSFGRSTDRDGICVQSTDGTLSVYVSGHLAVTSFPGSSLLPGPMAYHAGDDSVITVSAASRCLEGYRYKSLAVSQTSHGGQQRRVAADWRVEIGEAAIDVSVCPTAAAVVVVLCCHALFIVNNDSGALLKKRFEPRLRLMRVYGDCDDRGRPRLLLVTAAAEMLVMRGTQLLWQAAVSGCGLPTSVALATVAGVRNLVVTSDAGGTIAVVFLGTEPALGTVVATGGRLTGGDGCEEELEALRARMKAATGLQGPGAIPRARETRGPGLRLTVDLSSGRMVTPEDGGASEYLVDLRVRALVDVASVLLRVRAPRPLEAREAVRQWRSLSPGAAEAVWPLAVRTNGSGAVVGGLRVVVYATYEPTDGVGGLRCAQTAFQLPLGLVMQAVPPRKAATHRVTVDLVAAAGVDLPPLGRLFPEMGARDEPAIGLQYRGDGPVVTVLASMAARRYRLQSDHFEGLWLVMRELQARVTSEGCGLKSSEGPPLASVAALLEAYHNEQQSLEALERLLEGRARQLRAVEKLLLARARAADGEPSLHNLDSLAENGVRQLLQLSGLVEDQRRRMQTASASLSCGMGVLGLCLRLAGAPPEGLEAALATDPGEALSTAIQHLLGAASTSRGAAVGVEAAERLMRYLSILSDRCMGPSAPLLEHEDKRSSNGPEEAVAPSFVHSPRAPVAPKRGRRRKDEPVAVAS